MAAKRPKSPSEESDLRQEVTHHHEQQSSESREVEENLTRELQSPPLNPFSDFESNSSANQSTISIFELEPISTHGTAADAEEVRNMASKRHGSEDGQGPRRITDLLETPNLPTGPQWAVNGLEAGTTNQHWSPSGSSLPTPPSTITPQPLPLHSLIPSQNRSRGFSLRRSLFARNINGQSLSNDSVLELQPETNISRSHEPSGGIIEPQFNKNSGTTITIAPVADDMKHTSRSLKEARITPLLQHYENWVRNRAAQSVFLTRLKGLYVGLSKIILRIHDIPPSKDGRHIQLDASRKESLVDERTEREYIDNTIRSSRYTLWNFLPRQLFAQFSKLANFYFLCVSILQMIPGLSTTGSYTTIVPLTFFVTLSMAKEGFDDFRRYRLDRAENNRMTSVLRAYKPTVPRIGGSDESLSMSAAPKHWVNTKWWNVRVGDIIKLTRNEAAPADLVILNVAGRDGIAYIETMALDGETNLKSKQATPPLGKQCQNVEDIARCDAHLVVEDPNLDLYNFEGKCTVINETLPLTSNEIIYRGSVLRNTPELYGMVIYTGEECKIRMNATKNPRIKAPSLQAVVNKVVVIIVLFVLVLAVFNTIAYQIWYRTTEKKAWYLKEARVAFFPILTSFIILFNTMIPLSLYVSLEIVKLFQLVLMNDIDMYDEESNTPMEARTSNINEELGQVKYAILWLFEAALNCV